MKLPLLVRTKMLTGETCKWNLHIRPRQKRVDSPLQQTYEQGGEMADKAEQT